MTDGSCESDVHFCLRCTNKRFCLECAPNHRLSNGQCYSREANEEACTQFYGKEQTCLGCKDAYTLIINAGDEPNYCVDRWLKGCKDAAGMDGPCVTCDNMHALRNGLCISRFVKNCKEFDGTDACIDCDDGYSLLNGECISCDVQDCLECNEENVCGICLDGFEPHGPECWPVCPDDPACHFCVVVDNCWLCHHGYKRLESGFCEPDCNVDNCRNCVQSNFCSICEEGFTPLDGHCITDSEYADAQAALDDTTAYFS